MKGKSSQPKEIRRLTASRSVSSLLGRLGGGGGAPGLPGGLIPWPGGVLGGDEYILATFCKKSDELLRDRGISKEKALSIVASELNHTVETLQKHYLTKKS